MNDFKELMNVARFADDDVMLDHACSVGLPVALNAKPPTDIHVWRLELCRLEKLPYAARFVLFAAVMVKFVGSNSANATRR